MTKKELGQLYYLNREIERETRRLRELEALATGTGARITGLPHAGLCADKTAMAAEISDAKAVISAKVQLAVVQYNRLNRYIAAIDDSLIRQILSLRFVNGFSWAQVAANIGGGNTADSVRVTCERFLAKK